MKYTILAIITAILLTACSFKLKLTHDDKAIEMSGSIIRPAPGGK